MKDVGAGELNTCAELQRKVAKTRTPAGGETFVWERERDVFCRIKGLSMSMKLEAGAREPQITHEIVARQENDIDATKRLVVPVNGSIVGGRAFMIDGIPDDVGERGKYVRLMVIEGVAT